LKYLNLISEIAKDHSPIIGREKYLNSSVLIPIVEVDNKEYFLFQKRSQSVRQPGEVSFPGGHFEANKDEDFHSTAIRETCEELGVPDSKIDVLGKLGTLVAPMGVIVEAFVGKINITSLDELKIDTKEVEKVFLVPIDFFMENKPYEYQTRLELHPSITDKNGDREELLPVKDLGLPDRYALPWTRGKHRVLVYKNTEEIIWGITAELVYELTNLLKEKIDK
jgi:8-oxo-dGTP pyrophosphatase MutT (NUDIX family)